MKTWPFVLLALLVLGGAAFSLRDTKKQPAHATLTPTPLLPPSSTLAPAAQAKSSPAPSPPAALQDAKKYYTEHIVGIQHLLNVDYPQAVARRKQSHPNLPAARAFFRAYPGVLGKLDPSKDSKQAWDKLFAGLSQEEQDRLKPLVQAQGGSAAIEFYGKFLTDTTAIGTTTVSEIFREALQSHEGAKNTRRVLRGIEQDVMHDQAAVARVDALQTGPELTNYLLSALPRYQARPVPADAAPTLPPELGATLRREIQAVIMADLAVGYDQSVLGEERQLQERFLEFQDQMRNYLDRIPEDSPEKREILTNLGSLYAQITPLAQG